MKRKRNSLGQFVMERALAERFWSKVDVRGPDECWEWLAGKNTYGYGRIGIGNDVYNAPRVSYELIVGPIPEGLCVLHHCDNPGCVNPDHLFLGTQIDNIIDMNNKKRGATGERHGKAKLNNIQIISIREEYAQGNISRMELADKYNTTYGNIGYIVRRKTWKYI